MNKIRRKHILNRTCSRQQAILFTIVVVSAITFESSTSFDGSNLLVDVILLWRYILMVFVVYDVWVVAANEPTDPVLAGEVHLEEVNADKVLFCILCDHLVSKESHHCFRCERCAYDFDHHCKYLNVCIGGKNYIAFLKLLASFVLYCSSAAILLVRE